MRENESGTHPSAHSLTRRDFARRAALTAATAAVLPATVFGQAESPAPAPPQPPDLSPAGKAELEAKFQEILRRYGARLSEEQKAEVRNQLVGQVKSLETLRAYRLDNSDQPATVLRLPRPEKG